MTTKIIKLDEEDSIALLQASVDAYGKASEAGLDCDDECEFIQKCLNYVANGEAKLSPYWWFGVCVEDLKYKTVGDAVEDAKKVVEDHEKFGNYYK